MWCTDRADGPPGSCAMQEIPRSHGASFLSHLDSVQVYISNKVARRLGQQHSDYELLPRRPYSEAHQWDDEHPHLHHFYDTFQTQNSKMVNLSAVRVGSVRCECRRLSCPGGC